MIEYAALSDATPSASMKEGSVGGPSDSPVVCANPLIASPRVPNPGRDDLGPVRPNPVTCSITILGLILRSAS